MDGYPLERIRTARFSLAMRGYDRARSTRSWPRSPTGSRRGGEDAAGSERVRDELARMGEQMGAILTEAHEAAASMREEAEPRRAGAPSSLVGGEDATAEVRCARDAAEYAARARIEADEYAGETRGEADAYAASTR